MDRPPTRGLWELTPVTHLFIAISVAMYVLTVVVSSQEPVGGNGGGSWFSGPSVETLTRFGASFREGIWDGGWHRFVAPLVLHAGILHLVMNMWALYVIGPGAELQFGSANFASLYILSGVGGVCCSLIFGGHLSVGASTSLFGLLGAVLSVHLIECWDWRRALRTPGVRRVAGIIALNFIVVGLMVPNVDNWGHLGGLVAGLIWACIFECWRRGRRVAFVFLALACAFSAAGIVGSRWMVWDPQYYVHAGLKAENDGDLAAAQARYDQARRRARVWSAEGARRELAATVQEVLDGIRESQDLVTKGKMEEAAERFAAARELIARRRLALLLFCDLGHENPQVVPAVRKLLELATTPLPESEAPAPGG